MTEVATPAVEKVLRTAYAVVEKDRKLARIVVIDDVKDHPNADRLDLAIVGGWQCVIKKGEYKPGDKAVYCEIDSMLPIDYPAFNFLEERSSDNRTVDGKRFHRLKTAKFRKELAQGLLIPVPAKFKNAEEDTNLTLELGILKYEPKPPQVQQTKEMQGSSWYMRLARKILGNIGGALLPWPAQLTKSDQDRIQNKSVMFRTCQEAETLFEVTFKLDGSSMTCFLIVDEGQMRDGVCSRNYELQVGGAEYTFMEQLRLWLGTTMFRNRRFFKTWKWNKVEWKKGADGTSDHFTEMYTKLNISQRLRAYYEATGVALTIQGELIGPNIQSNFEGVEENQYYVFSVYKNGSEEVLPDEAREIVKELGLNYVPVFDESFQIPKDWEIADILLMAEGQRAFNPVEKSKHGKATYREGLVFKMRHKVGSFKAISTNYLLNEKD